LKICGNVLKKISLIVQNGEQKGKGGSKGNGKGSRKYYIRK
jgi:hypothetical protein